MSKANSLMSDEINTEIANLPGHSSLINCSVKKPSINPPAVQNIKEFCGLEDGDRPEYLVLLHVASYGRQGAALGSDESTVAMLTAKLYDIRSQSITGPEWQVPVKAMPRNHQNQGLSGSVESMDISCSEENDVSEECQVFTGLSSADVNDAPTLPEALESFDAWLRSQGLCYVNEMKESVKISKKCSFELAVDGGTGLRLVLHQSLLQPIEIFYTKYPYLYRFIDLKKAYALLFPTTASSFTLEEMLQSLKLQPPEFPPNYCPESAAWLAMPENSATKPDSKLEEEHFHPIQSCRDLQPFGFWPRIYCRSMAKLCRELTASGAEWNKYESISVCYQPKFVRKTETVPEDVAVRARGLPWQTTDAEIHNFFRGLNITPGGIALVLSKAGRRNGEAVICFVNREQRELALKKHKHHMNQRYIEVYAAPSAEFITVAGGETQEAEIYLSKFTYPSQSLIRMRGLPYTVSADEIIEFFAKTDCAVQFNKDGILFVNRKDGRATGDAFVMFATDDEAERALKNHRQHIGNRYIELFRSTPAEVNQVMNVVLKQTVDIMPHLWPSMLDQESHLPQTSPLLDLQSQSLLTSAAKGLLIPNHTFPIHLLNAQPMALVTSNALGNMLPGVTPNLSLLMTGHLMRMKGMPPGTTVNDILNFLGIYWQVVALHGIHLIYTATGEPTGEAFVRFVSEQALQLVMANKQGQPIRNALTGAQTSVQLSQATSADMIDFISIPGSQPAINWSPTMAVPNATATGAATFSGPINTFPLLTNATPLSTPLVMQLRALAPFTNQMPITFTPNDFAPNQKSGFNFSAPQLPTGIKVNADILFQAGIHAGPQT